MPNSRQNQERCQIAEHISIIIRVLRSQIQRYCITRDVSAETTCTYRVRPIHVCTAANEKASKTHELSPEYMVGAHRYGTPVLTMLVRI